MAYIEQGWRTGNFSPDSPTYNRIGSERRFGVELEFDDLPESVYDLEGETVFGAKEDCSVEGGEFVSPILYGDEGLAECENFCDHANDHNFVAGSHAGYHLHCDMTNDSAVQIKSVWLAYHYTYKFWKRCISERRRQNSYCRDHNYNHRDIKSLPDSLSGITRWCSGFGRYTWFNPTALSSHGTAEIRFHEGTKEHKDVTNWIIAHSRFIDSATEMSVGQITRVFGGNRSASDTFREIRVMLCDSDVSEHLNDRYRRFNPSINR